jgi:hypothetical protein
MKLPRMCDLVMNLQIVISGDEVATHECFGQSVMATVSLVTW